LLRGFYSSLLHRQIFQRWPDTGVTLMAADAGETRSADVRRKRRGHFNCRAAVAAVRLARNNISRFLTIISIFTLSPASSYRLASEVHRRAFRFVSIALVIGRWHVDWKLRLQHG
jgi:hypothetical protein